MLVVFPLTLVRYTVCFHLWPLGDAIDLPESVFDAL